MSKQFSDDQIRAAVNEEDPREAFAMLLTLFQRMVVSLETIAEQNTPGRQTLFGQTNTE